VGGAAGRLTLFAAVRAYVRRHRMLAGGDVVLVAVSGGADSIALLHVLHALAPADRLRLHVAHVDHGLRPESGADAAFVRTVGERLGIPVDVLPVTVPAGGSLEARAREVRYAALEAAADRLGATRIALGHTADDQAETVLMRLLEGAGVRGVAGIPPVRGRIIRPLLGVRRGALRAELERAGLAWVEDPTNRDPKFFRNRVRHEILPLLEDAVAGDVADRLRRVAAAARDAVEALDQVAAGELARLARREDAAIVLPLAALRALPPSVAAEVLRRAAGELGARAPLRAWAHRGLGRILADPPPRRAWRLGGVTVEVSVGLVRLGAGVLAPLPRRPLPVPGAVALPEIGRTLTARLVDAAGYVVPRDPERVAFDAAALPGPLVVRGRLRGDRFVPYGGPGERRLKTFLIDAKIPRWRRARLPVVEAAGVVVWIGGVRRGAAAPIEHATRQIVELTLAQPEYLS
jgi:tRNA(Ile)-lysidine synthase